MRTVLTAALLSTFLAGCSGIDLGDNPRPDTAKQTGPLIVPPALRTGPSK